MLVRCTKGEREPAAGELRHTGRPVSVGPSTSEKEFLSVKLSDPM